MPALRDPAQVVPAWPLPGLAAAPVTSPGEPHVPGVIGVSAEGALVRAGRVLDPRSPETDTRQLLELAWLLCRTPSAVLALPEAARSAVARHLASVLADPAVQVPEEGAGKLQAASLWACLYRLLRTCTPAGDGSRTGPPRPVQPLLQALVAEAHGGTLDPEAEALLEAFDQLASPEPVVRAEHRTWPLDASSALVMLSGACFCRNGEAWENLQSGHPAFARIHTSGSSWTPQELDAIELEALRSALAGYIEGSSTTVFQYGLWKGEAERAAGAVRNAEATAHWLGPRGSLAASPPALQGVVLEPGQAVWFLANLDLIRDGEAAGRFIAGLERVQLLFEDRPALAPTAFHLFAGAHDRLRARGESSKDGRLDYTGLDAELLARAGRLPEALEELRGSLRADPPRWGRVSLDGQTAADLLELLATRVRRDRSLDNLEEALFAWATQTLRPAAQDAPEDVDGTDEQGVSAETEAPMAELVGEEARAFLAFLGAYLDTWPDLQVFDFNKLGRMALAERTGDPVPLCRLDGEARDPGTFHVAVGEAVMAAIPAGHLAQPWMARRFGYRAKQCIELVDLLAEQQSRGLGPLPALFAAHPEARVRVIATTSDLFYNLLVFGQELPGQAVRWLYLDSEGALTERRRPEHKHRLFEAVLDASGHLDVVVDTRLGISRRAYPLQNPYGLGDRVDIELYDRDAREAQTATERFETRYRVVQGTIVSYDARGRHRVQTKEPGGEVVIRELGYDELRQQNNPHYVSEQDGLACSTRFRLSRDARLREDLDAMEAIARRTGVLEHPLDLDELGLARLQKQLLTELNAYTSKTLLYPRKPPVDDKDRRYWDHLDFGTHPAGTYLEWQRGVCRHMFIREHMGKQRAGIDERFASGAANTYSGDFRGLHIWGEVSLADKARLGHDNPEPRDTRYLSDATWKDPYVPLWDGAYGNDARRVEMYDRTNYRSHLVVKT